VARAIHRIGIGEGVLPEDDDAQAVAARQSIGGVGICLEEIVVDARLPAAGEAERCNQQARKKGTPHGRRRFHTSSRAGKFPAPIFRQTWLTIPHRAIFMAQGN
jgi:hypothetical protein